MSTTFPSAQGLSLNRKWYVVDAAGQTVGRLATEVARVLTGKNKPQYTPFMDTGDHVIVINAEKVRVTGKKEQAKMYYRHPNAGFPGGLKSTNLEKLRQRHPEDIIINAVRRMLPRNALGRQMMTKLKVYAGNTHPHAAQKPTAREVEA